MKFKEVYQHPLLGEHEHRQITNAHHRKKFKKGDFILQVNEVAQEYLIVENGLLRSFVYDYHGNDITTNFFGTHQIVIEVSSLFQRIPTQENIQALTDCTCWSIDFEAFQKLFHSIEGFSEWGRAWMSQQLFQAKQRSVDMIALSAAERYKTLVEKHPEIIKNAPLKHIASFLGITDTSLSRIRKEVVRH